jgi:hypothetical protein
MTRFPHSLVPQTYREQKQITMTSSPTTVSLMPATGTYIPDAKNYLAVV